MVMVLGTAQWRRALQSTRWRSAGQGTTVASSEFWTRETNGAGLVPAPLSLSATAQTPSWMCTISGGTPSRAGMMLVPSPPDTIR